MIERKTWQLWDSNSQLLSLGALVAQWLVRWVRDLKICSSNPHPAQYFLVILQCNLNDSESINGCSLKESYNF